MSLDVYLTLPGGAPRTGSGIFVREAGSTREISRAEWDEKFPGRVPVTFTGDDEDETVYRANITHNLSPMAAAAGLYEHLWRPEECGIERAEQLIAPLTAGLERLETEAADLRRHNPVNGWGDHDGLVDFVRRYLDACREHPTALVRASR